MKFYEIIMVELSGKEFKALYPNIRFWKLTNSIEIHYGLEFKDGLN